MGLWSFGTVCLPYCLYKNEAGEWIALNREYKPIGFKTDKWIAYEQYPIAIKYKRDKKMREKFHVGNTDNKNWIYLYNDASAPHRSRANMRAYMERLSILAMQEVEDGYDYGQPLGFEKRLRSKGNRGVARKTINKAHYIKLHIEKHGNHCYYCGDEMALDFSVFNERKWPTIDHIEPLVKGGSDNDDNYLVCCKQCNCTKHAKNLEEFRSYMERKLQLDTKHQFFCEKKK